MSHCGNRSSVMIFSDIEGVRIDANVQRARSIRRSQQEQYRSRGTNPCLHSRKTTALQMLRLLWTADFRSIVYGRPSGDVLLFCL